jgi:hypothetical protein
MARTSAQKASNEQAPTSEYLAPHEEEAAIAPATGPDYPDLADTPDWRFFHPPGSWAVYAGQSRPLPDLVQVELAPGLNLVGKDGDTKYARSEAARRMVEIPLRAGGLPVNYVKKTPTKAGRLAHVALWTKTFPGASTTRTDTAGYLAWLGRLVDEGVCAPLTVAVAEQHLTRAIQERDRLADTIAAKPSIKPQLVEADRVVSVWQQALAKLTETDAPISA